MIYNSVVDMIGNTPLLKIPEDVHGLRNIDVYAKLEYMNPFGSVKDRLAYGLMKDHVVDMKAKGQKPVIVSNANSAKAVTILSHIYGLSPYIVSNKMPYKEVKQQFQFLGAEIKELPAVSQCPNPFDPQDMLQYAYRMVSNEPEKYHLVDQFADERNPQIHYENTAKEVYEDLGKIDHFFAVLGSSGTTLGAGRFFREKNENAKIYGVITEAGHNAPGGRSKNELWEVGIFNPNHYDEILSGTSQQAVEGMRTLNMKCGVLCGPTAGLAFNRMLNKLREQDVKLEGTGHRQKAVFIACDRMEPYMSYVEKTSPKLFDERKSDELRVQTLDMHKVQNAPQVYNTELEAWLADGEDVLVIDTRGSFSYSIGSIPSAINIQDTYLEEMLNHGEPISQKQKNSLRLHAWGCFCTLRSFCKREGL